MKAVIIFEAPKIICKKFFLYIVPELIIFIFIFSLFSKNLRPLLSETISKL